MELSVAVWDIYIVGDVQHTAAKQYVVVFKWLGWKLKNHHLGGFW